MKFSTFIRALKCLDLEKEVEFNTRSYQDNLGIDFYIKYKDLLKYFKESDLKKHGIYFTENKGIRFNISNDESKIVFIKILYNEVYIEQCLLYGPDRVNYMKHIINEKTSFIFEKAMADNTSVSKIYLKYYTSIIVSNYNSFTNRLVGLWVKVNSKKS